MKQVSGSIYTSVSTKVEVVLTDIKLGNIKVTETLQYFISIFTQLQGLQNFSSVYPIPPRILSYTVTL